MAEKALDLIRGELGEVATQEFPQWGCFKDLRAVGHVPKKDHFLYHAYADFEGGSAKLAIKIYRPNKCGGNARAVAKTENANLQYVRQVLKKKLTGVPRPLGDFSQHGAVVTEKLSGLPMQPIIMKAALLPGYADLGSIAQVARCAGEWLRAFHRASADMPEPTDADEIIDNLTKACKLCRAAGLDDASIGKIMESARKALAHSRKPLPTSAVLNDFTPLNVLVSDQGAGFSNFAAMKRRGSSLEDAAVFLAAVEALEKYPFCDRQITSRVQESFVEAYGVTRSEIAVLSVLKMKALLGMFAQGRSGKAGAERKQAIWATVMKKFIQQAAHRMAMNAAAA
ncbi:MAG TPA: hypothetical protein VNW97_16650 [Candidatus Saccharimonadales bacterium]|jgi:hypothetical protein|nr:hypothetical protein [Candidatus Saccharimonadales bacterium]